MLLTVALGKHISAMRNFRHRLMTVLPMFCDCYTQRGGIIHGT
jgi:hypothetical protein